MAPAIVGESPGNEGQREHQQEHRQQWRDADCQLLGPRPAGEQAEEEHERRDRQIDQPAPVDVRAIRRRHAVLAQIPPALPCQPVPDLQVSHVVVSVRKRKILDRGGVAIEEIGGDQEPGDDDDPAPFALDERVNHAPQPEGAGFQPNRRGRIVSWHGSVPDFQK